MALATGTRLGPYEVSGSLGAGGMGEVYRAKDTRLGRSVAIKVLPPDLAADPERKRRFEQEARAVSALNHPNICALYDIGSASLPGTPRFDYLVMEFLDGQSLANRIAKGPMPLREALECAAQVADALSKAHRQGVVHRDIKPGNVILTKEGAKLLDFGLAKARPVLSAVDATATQSVTSFPVTQAGVVVGTVPYMAPEQLEGHEADARTDIFAFGAMLYEMLSGRRAFDGASQASVIASIMTADPPSLAERQTVAPPSVERLVRQCLIKDPDKRWQSAGDIARHLEGILEELHLPLSGTGTAVIAAPPQSRTRRIAFLSVGGLVVAALAGAAFLIGKRASDRPLPTFHRLTFRRGTVGNAFFTPDGQSVVYTAQWDGQPKEIFTVRADGVDSVPRDGTKGFEASAISSKNELALTHRATLSTAPLASGAPRDILRGVTSADWNPDGSQLAVARRGALEYPAGKVIYKARQEFLRISNVRVSPRGDLLAFQEHDIGHGKIVVIDTAGKIKTESSYYDGVHPPSWTPAGEEVWFSATTLSGKESIRALNLAGRERSVLRDPLLLLKDISRDGRVLLSTDDYVFSMNGKTAGDTAERNLTYYGWSLLDDISPDGRTIMFTEGGESDNTNDWSVFLRGTDGSPPQRLGRGFYGKMSPDGKWVATLVVDRNVPFGKGGDQVMLIPTGADEQRPVTHNNGVRHGVIGWLPDSSAVLYCDGKRTWLAPVDGRPPAPVTPEGWVGTYLVSPDGKHVLASPPNEDSTMYSFSLDGREKVHYPALDLAKWEPVGFHDATRVRVVPFQPLGVEAIRLPVPVYLLDLKSGKVEPWKEIGAEVPRAGLTTNLSRGIRLAFSADGESYAFTYGNRLSTLYVAEGLR